MSIGPNALKGRASGVVSSKAASALGRRPALAADVAAHGWQFDLAGPLQHQQQAAANHVAQRAVGLFPAQRFTQLPRQLPPAAARVRRDERPEESNLLTADLLPTVAPGLLHDRSMAQTKPERKHFV
jgi:hypothetical protein